MSAPKTPSATQRAPHAALVAFMRAHPTLTVLGGAGCSTASGIGDYRDEDGNWKRIRPIQYRDFVNSHDARQRYWARSMVGWQNITTATPNEAHYALAKLEQAGKLHYLITQNVDGLHQRAGSERVIDLHGTLTQAHCLTCATAVDRSHLQVRLRALNPHWSTTSAAFAPDGDADLDNVDFSRFTVPGCETCGGVLKPAVVFFGENVPRGRVEQAYRRVAEADALLVVGSSLMVFSGYRFVRAARERGQAIAILNLGRTRADDEVDLKVEAACGPALTQLTAALG